MKTLLRNVAFLGTIILAITWLIAERGRLLRRSTWEMWRLAGWQALRDGRLLHGYVYARWPYLYIGTAIKHTLARLKPYERQAAADHYHGKVLPTQLARALVSVQEDIPRRDLEHVIPYPVARDLVLAGPPDVALLECPCRAAREHPCEPADVCMIVGQPFVDFALEHHPGRTRRVTTAEALAVLEAEHARGHVHAAFFKDVMLNRFYAICNCCACCCGALQAMQKHGVPMVASSGYVAQIDAAECIACGVCADYCPFGAIHTDGVTEVDWAACMGCGVCAGQCPSDAITLILDARKGIPLDVRTLVRAN